MLLIRDLVEKRNEPVSERPRSRSNVRYARRVTILKIAHVGNPVLRQRSRELSREELARPETQRFIDDLVETMREANGAGIAAPQVGNPIRVCVVHVQENARYPYMPDIPLTIMVNPVLTPIGSETFQNYEGCLSVPNLRGIVDRFTRIELAYWDRHGEDRKATLRGLSAGVFQHECDHLDGKLFLDRVSDTTTLTTWADFEQFHKAGFVEKMMALVAREGG
ncbi:MAG: peptide deformylase [Myxococcales bacterium]|nr:peptide deformylase [Myxococcales bacterium]